MSGHKSDVERLSDAGVQNAQRDLDALGIYAEVSGEDIKSLIDRRVAREPMERITGIATFMDAEFYLTKEVFKPGFETETTTEYALLVAEEMGRAVRILDLGTGTGCILISLLKRLPDAIGVGVDRSSEVLQVAQHNAKIHDVADRASFVVSDWATALSGPFDIVISNPPRVPTAEIAHLVREVSLYDPRTALDGGAGGLDFYERTAEDFRRIAAVDAVGVLQVWAPTADKVVKVFVRAGYRDVRVCRDYKYGLNCVVFRNNLSETKRFSLRQRLAKSFKILQR